MSWLGFFIISLTETVFWALSWIDGPDGELARQFYTVALYLGIWGSLILLAFPTLFWMVAVQDSTVSFEGNFVWHMVIGTMLWLSNWLFHWLFMNTLDANTSGTCYCIPCRKVRSCSRLTYRQEECELERESNVCDCICAEKCSACTDWSCKETCIPDDGCPNLDRIRDEKKLI